MDERKEEHNEPQEDEQRRETEALEDLDVPEGESDDVKGGTYSFKQAWPKKYTGTG